MFPRETYLLNQYRSYMRASIKVQSMYNESVEQMKCVKNLQEYKVFLNVINNCIMCLCLGPAKSGKTFLMKRLQGDEMDDATHTVNTNGINLFTIKNNTGEFDIIVKEIGGGMAPIWKYYFDKIRKIIYVVDTSNLCQISAAGVLFYSLLVEPRLRNIKIALTLNKMDLSYRQMRNEALLMLQFSRLQKEVTQELTIFETSGMTGQGVEELRNWLFDPATLKAAINANK